MPKKRTKKAAAKRLRLTSKGRLKFARAGKGHLLSSKSRKTKRHMRRAGIVAHADERRLKNLL